MTQQQLKELEINLWAAADKLRAESGLKASQYATPVLGIIFLRFASIRYNKVKKEITAEYEASKNSRNTKKLEDIALLKCGFYLPEEAEYDFLLNLPESENIAKKIKEAMELIEKFKPELEGSLPKDEYYSLILKNKDDASKEDFSLAKSLLKAFKDIPEDATGDVFGKVYEFFLSEFALAEGQGGGDFFTPTSVVKLMVEIIEPYSGTIYDPACGSGGMFVQSSGFVDKRREEEHETDTKDLTVYGNTKDSETVKIARMNLAVNGLRGQVVQADTYYEDPYDCYEKFDYVLANPPFNVDDVNLDRVKEQRRFNKYGIPQNKTKPAGKKKEINTVPNANYLWINLFATSLKKTGRAGLVMANSASDARNSEADIRKNLIKSGVIDCMLTLPKNMFYTVTLPATLWFFDKNNEGSEPTILFIDARNIFRQVDRSHREFTDEHIENIASIVRLYRGENSRFTKLINKYKTEAKNYKRLAEEQFKVVEDFKKTKPIIEKDIKRWEKQLDFIAEEHKQLISKHQYYLSNVDWLEERFPNSKYEDVIGLCKAATLTDLEEEEWSLNPGRYVGVVIEDDGLSQEEFIIDMKKRHFDLNILNEKAKDLEDVINSNLLNI